MSVQSIEQLGVCSWSLQANCPMDLANKVNALGLKRLQIGLVALHNEPDVWENVQNVLLKYGIQIVSGMFSTIGEDYTTPQTIRQTGGMVSDVHWDENWILARDIAQTANELGLKLVSAHVGFLPHEPADAAFKKLCDRVAKIAELFAKNDGMFLLETGQERAETLLTFLDALQKRGVRNVGVNFDPANMLLYDMDEPVAALQQLIPHIVQVHVKDAKRTNFKGQWGTEVIVGTGEVDWDAFVRFLAQADFNGSYIFEREAGENRLGDILQGITVIREAMEKVGG